jgi:hypothetical protein
MADVHDPNENNFLARIGQIAEKPIKAAPIAEKEE